MANLTEDEHNFINLLHKIYIEETKMEDEVVEPMYYENACDKCGQTFNCGGLVWDNMTFCSEECMNREKEYWYDVEQLKEQNEAKP